ncbi:hypothetical protein OAK97_00625 [bacterium]|nr:hypothetical protein [bacterium]
MSSLPLDIRRQAKELIETGKTSAEVGVLLDIIQQGGYRGHRLPIGQRWWAFLCSQVTCLRPKACFFVLQTLAQFVMA